MEMLENNLNEMMRKVIAFDMNKYSKDYDEDLEYLRTYKKEKIIWVVGKDYCTVLDYDFVLAKGSCSYDKVLNGLKEGCQCFLITKDKVVEEIIYGEIIQLDQDEVKDILSKAKEFTHIKVRVILSDGEISEDLIEDGDGILYRYSRYKGVEIKDIVDMEFLEYVNCV